MVQDLVHNLCESLVENIGGVSGATSRKVVVATPVITLTGNSVTITCATTGATIYYTLDGSTPTSSSTQYSSAFTLDSSCTIKAIAINGGKSSGIAEEEYVKPITYLTQWKIVGNSEVHGTEIWSCGEYSEVDNKWHIRILPEGYGIVDIALDEPFRKVNDVADIIEFADGVVTLTRKITATKVSDNSWWLGGSADTTSYGFSADITSKASGFILLCAGYNTINSSFTWNGPDLSIGSSDTYSQRVYIKDLRYSTRDDFLQGQGNNIIFYELITPTTETIQVPQIAEADSYTCVISQGGKAVSWSSFETE